MNLALILAALGLPEGATAEQVTDFAVKAKETQVSLGKLLGALGLQANASESDIAAKLEQLKAPGASLTKLLGALKVSSVDEAVGVVAALRANSEQTDGDGYVKVMAALGASSPDEALGIVEAFKSAKSRLADTESRLADLEVKQTQGERDELIGKLRSEGKITPAQEKDVLPGMSLETLKAFAKTAVPVLKGDGRREPGSGKSYAGKAFKDLTPAEARALHDEDPDTFNRLVTESRQ